MLWLLYLAWWTDLIGLVPGAREEARLLPRAGQGLAEAQANIRDGARYPDIAEAPGTAPKATEPLRR